MNAAEFKVVFGKIGWTLLYEEPQGHLIFVYELGEKEKQMILARIPVQDEVEANPYWHDQSRIDVALERAKAFLISRGYDVQIG